MASEISIMHAERKLFAERNEITGDPVDSTRRPSERGHAEEEEPEEKNKSAEDNASLINFRNLPRGPGPPVPPTERSRYRRPCRRCRRSPSNAPRSAPGPIKASSRGVGRRGEFPGGAENSRRCGGRGRGTRRSRCRGSIIPVDL
jgi:hypothetical protein